MEDLLVDYTRELNLLKIPLEQGQVFRLINESQLIPFEILLQQMVTYLHANFGLDKNAAQWAIETWAEALEIHQITSGITDFSTDFICEITSGIAPLKTYFTPKYSNPQATYHWVFGDGKESDEQNPCHEYSEAGTFSVSLQISLDGCIEEKRVDNLIKVKSNLQSENNTNKKKQKIINSINNEKLSNCSVEGKNVYFSDDKRKLWIKIGVALLFLISVIGILGLLLPNIMQGEDIQKSIWPEITTKPTENVDQFQTNNYSTDFELIHVALVKLVPLIKAWNNDVESANYNQLSVDTVALKNEIIDQQKSFNISDQSKIPHGNVKRQYYYYYTQYLLILQGLVQKTDETLKLMNNHDMKFSDYEKTNLFRNAHLGLSSDARLKLKDMFDSCSRYEGKCGADDPIISPLWKK